jgi:hypothetical protein
MDTPLHALAGLVVIEAGQSVQLSLERRSLIGESAHFFFIGRCCGWGGDIVKLY